MNVHLASTLVCIAAGLAAGCATMRTPATPTESHAIPELTAGSERPPTFLAQGEITSPGNYFWTYEKKLQFSGIPVLALWDCFKAENLSDPEIPQALCLSTGVGNI